MDQIFCRQAVRARILGNPLGNGLGLGLINNSGILDQAPGNVNAVDGAGLGAVLPVGLPIHDLYQANLGSVQAQDTTNLFSNGTNGGFGGPNRFFTFVASFAEKVVASVVVAIPGGVQFINNFAVDGGGTFKMCKQSAIGNNLTGFGFGCDAMDTILSGRIDGGDSSQTATFKPAIGFPVLDQAGVNNWPGTTTIPTIGTADLVATIKFVNAMYFPDLLIGRKIAINSSLVTPYKQVDPSQSFSTGLVFNDTPTDIGAVNGIIGPNFIFQADANSSFDAPEPGALALGGIALAGLALLRSRRKQSV